MVTVYSQNSQGLTTAQDNNAPHILIQGQLYGKVTQTKISGGIRLEQTLSGFLYQI
jgi:hypothetical protein